METKMQWCGNCIHCEHDPNYTLRGYYCLRDFEGDIGEASHATDGVIFLANQGYEPSMVGCGDWEEAKHEAELDALLADICAQE